LLHVQF
jgi:hypothetical protein